MYRVVTPPSWESYGLSDGKFHVMVILMHLMMVQ